MPPSRAWLSRCPTSSLSSTGLGPDQAPRQVGANTGDSEGGLVRLADDGFKYPSPSSVLTVTLTPQ
jgi:hypothetical protein